MEPDVTSRSRRPRRRFGLRPIPVAAAGALLALAGLLLPSASSGAMAGPWTAVLAAAALLFALAGGLWSSLALVACALGSLLLALLELTGPAGPGFWLLFWGGLIAAVGGAGRISLPPPDADDEAAWRARLRAAVPPAVVPAVLLLLWQGLVVGNDVPKGIFPAVDDVVAALGSAWPVLLADSWVTFVREVGVGFAIGIPAGFLAGLAIAASRFLQRGFLPLAAAFGAVPIVGLAPVLGRAFGVDWESKAAVVVITTFFPVVINTVQGLTLVDPLKLELLAAYAASPLQVLLKLRLPNALPFLFNALKLATVLAVISVIVAEFLIPGPPEGLGQRISLSARRGAYDVVFAAIFVSSLISIALYGLVSALERWLSGWHPSFREEGA